MDASKKFVTLNTGAKMPTLGMGTWHHGPREEIDAALRFSIKKGYRHIDCAKVYLNEKEVGEVFKDIIDKEVPREELFIIGKLWGTDHHPDDVEPAIRQSLADLNLDYFDAYLIHWPTPFVVSNPISYFPVHSLKKSNIFYCSTERRGSNVAQG